MPWLTIIMALISFFAAGGSKKEKRAKAALTALGVGAATYGITHYTDWGKEHLGALDGVVLNTSADGTVSVVGEKGTAIPVSGPAANVQLKGPEGNTDSSSVAGNTGLWNAISGWLTSPAGQVASLGAAGTLSGLPNWVVWGGAGLIAWALLKD